MTRKLPELIEMIRTLVGTPSISSLTPSLDMGNRGMIDVLAEWASSLGFQVELMPMAHHPHKSNLIATLGHGPGGLVLSGHTDTVPFDEHRWSTDPFTLTERDGRLYGLGVVDMKSFLALALQAAARIDPATLKAPLIFLATADEETTMKGARALVAAGRPKARQAIIGEPTGLRPVRMHKGVMMESIRVHGRSGHSSTPALGLNAIEGMHDAIAEVITWRKALASAHHNPHFAVPEPTVNLGVIRGGDAANRICALCELHLDVRVLPGMSPEKARERLRARLIERLTPQGFGLDVDPLIEPIPPFETPADSALVRAVEALTGHAAEAVTFGTEAPFLSALGMDTLVCGPGHIAQAHQPDEFLALDQLNPTISLLESLIQRFCCT